MRKDVVRSSSYIGLHKDGDVILLKSDAVR